MGADPVSSTVRGTVDGTADASARAAGRGPWDVVVVGAGAIGMSVAWRLAQGGRSVLAVDPAPGQGASRAAAGMIAPVNEVSYAEDTHVPFNLAAAAAWPSFAKELEADSGRAIGYLRCGTLAIAKFPDDRDALSALAHHQASLGLDVEILTPSECRMREPALDPAIAGGTWMPGDHQVDNRRMLEALEVALAKHGVGVVHSRVRALDAAGGRISGAIAEDGAVLAAREGVVLAAGAWSAALGGSLPGPLGGPLGGLLGGAAIPVRPVKGQILRVARCPGTPALVVRGLVAGRVVYAVPRASGEIVVGATMEERGFDTSVRAGAVAELLTDLLALLPGMDEAELIESMAGLRPASPDNLPIIGPSGVDGLVLACGHGRNGILGTPLTAAIVRDVFAGVGPTGVACLADPARFRREADSNVALLAPAPATAAPPAGGPATAAVLP